MSKVSNRSRDGPDVLMIGGAVLAEKIKRRSFQLLDRRLDEMAALFRHRYGSTIPATDDVDLILAPYAETLAGRAEKAGQALDARLARTIAERLLMLAPDLSEVWARKMADEAVFERRRWSAADLGDRIALRPEERAALGISTIRPAGCRGTAWTEFRRERERLRSESRRREKGVQPRRSLAEEVRELMAKSGVSRATAYRMIKSAQHVETEKPRPFPIISAVAPSQLLHRNSPVAPSHVAQHETAAEEARRLGVHRSTILRRRRKDRC